MKLKRPFLVSFACLGASIAIFQNCSKTNFSVQTAILPSCEDVGSAGVAPKLKWDWLKELPESKDARWPSFSQVMASPVVADLDGDKKPEVVFISFSVTAGDHYADALIPTTTPPPATPPTQPAHYSRNGVLRIVEGKTGRTIKSVGEIDLAPMGSHTPLLVDIDRDGKVEIIYASYTHYQAGGARYQDLIALNSNGSLRWKYRLTEPTLIRPFGPTATDINGDGTVDVLIGRQVISETSSKAPYVLSTLPAPAVTASVRMGEVLFSRLKPGDTSSDSLITYDAIYNKSGAIKANFTHVATGLAVADLYPEISGLEVVTTAPGRLAVYNGLTGAVIQNMDLAPYNDLVCMKNGVASIGGGPPSVGDFDGDPETLEIAVATGRHLTVFNREAIPVFKFETQDCSSLVTGLTSFDLNGDKKREILYADEEYFRVYEITDGILQERHRLPNPNGTLNEYPVVADINGDFSAEILIVSNNYAAAGFYQEPHELEDGMLARSITGVRAFESQSENHWMPTRPLWNQYSFHPDQFNDRAQLQLAADVDPKIFRSNNQGVNRELECNNQGPVAVPF